MLSRLRLRLLLSRRNVSADVEVEVEREVEVVREERRCCWKMLRRTPVLGARMVEVEEVDVLVARWRRSGMLGGCVGVCGIDRCVDFREGYEVMMGK